MDHVRIDIADRVATVTLDRPPVNALTAQTFEEVALAMEQLSAGRQASAIVLRAADSARVFCGGVDLQDSPRRFRPDGRPADGEPQGDARDQVDPGRVARRCFNSIYECGLPVIAAVHGKAIGAGVAIVASCDLVVASTEASFALTEINVGVLGGVRHAQRLCGAFLAKRMFLTGEYVAADEIYRRGGIEAVVPVDELYETAHALARTIASKSPIAVRLAKESANRVESMELRAGYRCEQDYTQRVRRHADSDEARMAFVEKRPAEFHWE
jgi:enoyl-CoA hydratase